MPPKKTELLTRIAVQLSTYTIKTTLATANRVYEGKVIENNTKEDRKNLIEIKSNYLDDIVSLRKNGNHQLADVYEKYVYGNPEFGDATITLKNSLLISKEYSLNALDDIDGKIAYALNLFKSNKAKEAQKKLNALLIYTSSHYHGGGLRHIFEGHYTKYAKEMIERVGMGHLVY